MKILTAKQVSQILGVSIRTAQRYIKDIKRHYNLNTKITEKHLTDYFKV